MGHRLDEQESHAGPLEHRFGHQREGDQVADLQARDGDDRHQAVLQRVAEMDRAVPQAPRAREPHEVGAQHFQHLGAHQPHHQRDLEQRERDARQHERGAARSASGSRSTTSRAAPRRHGRSPEASRASPRRRGSAGCRPRSSAATHRPRRGIAAPARPARIAPDRRVDAERDADEQREQRRDQHQLERCRHALGDQLEDILLIAERNAEITAHARCRGR